MVMDMRLLKRGKKKGNLGEAVSYNFAFSFLSSSFLFPSLHHGPFSFHLMYFQQLLHLCTRHLVIQQKLTTLIGAWWTEIDEKVDEVIRSNHLPACDHLALDIYVLA